MNLRHLQYFCAVLDAGSTVAAAQRCHVSQSVVSAAMSQLEQEFGCTLFVRHQRGLQPTPGAWRLQHLARRVLADVAAMKTEIRPAEQSPPCSSELTRPWPLLNWGSSSECSCQRSSVWPSRWWQTPTQPMSG